MYTTPVPRHTSAASAASNTKGRSPLRPNNNDMSEMRASSTGDLNSSRLSQIVESPRASNQALNAARFNLDNVTPPPLNTTPSMTSGSFGSSAITPKQIQGSSASGRSMGGAATLNQRAHGQDSPVMNETLSVIDEHITDMGTPRHSIATAERRGTNDSGSEYSNNLDARFSYIPGQETDDEEDQAHTENEVGSWSPRQVAEYLAAVGIDRKQCEVLREQEINGEVLLGLDRSTLLMPEFDLGKLGPRLYLWQKIDSLQKEVTATKHSRQNSMTTAANDNNRSQNRSSSERSLQQSLASPTSPTSRPISNQRQQSSPNFQNSIPRSPLPFGTPNSGTSSPNRPSAALVRELNHSRRHSSADFGSPTSPDIRNESGTFSPLNRPPHRKDGSFDRSWTMGGAGSTVGSQPGSPDVSGLSTQHLRQLSSSSSTAVSAAVIRDPTELDRGYMSGGDIETGNSRRKRDSHARSQSYNNEQRRKSGTAVPSQSPGDTDLSLDSSSNKKTSNEPELMKKPIASQKTLTTAPTVTKLEYDTSSAKPQPDEPESPSLQSPVSKMSFIKKGKSRMSGMRASSDAVTGIEKASAISGVAIDSPVGTDPSMSSRSLELDPATSKTQPPINGRPAKSIARRKKSKKDTSAYRNGLMSISPKEQMIGCDYSGWMKKKSSKFITLWKPRLFVLKGRRLSYYYSESDTREQGLIDISFHRVIAADNERVTGLHAALTGAASSPASPENATTPTLASQETSEAQNDGIFIFKLTPPRTGHSGANFTQPEEHYFACDNAAQGRAWMAALMKVTIDLDTSAPIKTTYNQQTISLSKAIALRHRPPNLLDVEEDEVETGEKKDGKEAESGGLGIDLDGAPKEASQTQTAPPAYEEKGSTKAVEKGEESAIENLAEPDLKEVGTAAVE